MILNAVLDVSLSDEEEKLFAIAHLSGAGSSALVATEERRHIFELTARRLAMLPVEWATELLWEALRHDSSGTH